MGLTVDLRSAPFYGGAGASLQVPNVYAIALNGHPYMIDWSQPFYRQYKREITQLLRTQADVGTEPGEQSINPEDLWRRSQEDWSLGAGQRYTDRKDSTPWRYWKSLGINPWTKWQISLHNNVGVSTGSLNNNLQWVNVGLRCYQVDGGVLSYTLNPLTASPVYVTVTGMPGTAIFSVSTDGYNVYCATATGVYWTNTGTGAATQLVTSALDSACLVKWTNGRLMVTNLNSIYNVTSTSPAALPAALFTHSVPAFRWTAIAEGLTQIYFAGTSGNKSWIYGSTILTDGTALAPPIVQGQTPTGETITAMLGYLGFVAVGTSLGVRFALTDQSGGVTLAALIPLPQPCLALDGYDRFIWFSWSNYDAAHTGMGRMDLQNFAVAQVQPAYASDLMVNGQGQVGCIKTWQGAKVFCVNGVGFFFEDTTTKVPTGTLDSGLILFDLPDPKVGILLDVQSPVPLSGGSYTAYLSPDEGTFLPLGIHRVTDPDPVTFTVSQIQAARFEVRLTLNRDEAHPALGPVITRFTFRAWPTPRRPLNWQLPLIINERVTTISSNTDGFDPFNELTYLEHLCISGQVANFQEGYLTYPVLVSDVSFLPQNQTVDNHFFNGIALVQLKGIPPT